MTSDALRQLSTFLITHIARRRTNQARGIEAFRIFTHVDTDQRVAAAKHKLSEFLGQISLADTRRSQEHEHADGVIGVFQSDTIALNSLHHLVDGLVLCDDGTLQLLSHSLQADTLLFCHPLGRYTRHHRDDIGHLFGIHNLALLTFTRSPALVQRLQLLFQFQLAVAIACCQFVVLVLHGPLLLFLHVFDLLFLLRDLWRYLRIRKMYARTRLVEGVDGLIGHEAVCHIAGCQFDTCCQSGIRIGDVMVLLVAVLDVMQYLQRLLVGGRLHLNLLETTLQRTVLLDGVTILVECRSADALYGTARQCRLHDVGCIHRTRCGTRTDDGVYLIDEDDYVGIRLQLLHQGLQALLKLSSVLRTSDDARHIERIDALAEEHRRGVMLHDQLCQSFDDGTLAHARFSDEDGIVLLSAAQYLDDALYLSLTAHAGVELTLSGSLCEVGAEGVEHGRLRGRLLLRGSRSTRLGRMGTGRCGVFEFVLLFVGQVDIVGDAVVLLGKQHRHSVFVIHVVQF